MPSSRCIPFLKQVAQTYYANERENLIDYCFVFPNKRCIDFFRYYLTESMGTDTPVMPAVLTISEMMADFSDSIEASRFEQLFIIYKEYCRLNGDSDALPSFDKFLYWGDILINDFNDVDRYLVDSHKLFVNLRDFKEISADYLTDEQREIIRRFWGEDHNENYNRRFWNHFPEKVTDGDPHGKFLKLWMVLDRLFCSFKKELSARGLCSSGMTVRNAVEKIGSLSAEEFYYRRYVFVGFNVLSIAEVSIFEKLKAKGLADFYWDYNSPAYRLEGNKAMRFLRKYVEEFRSLYPLPEEPMTDFPEITVTGVPSRAGMVKEAAETLTRWAADGTIANRSNAIDTAVVLPEENLFIPLVHSIPDEISKINVTMGFPLRQTTIASLMSKIISLHMRARIVKGEECFYYEDVRDLATNPILQAIAPEECTRIIDRLRKKRLYTVSASLLADRDATPADGLFGLDCLRCVFAPIVDDSDIEAVYTYCHNLVTGLLELLQSDSTDGDGAPALAENKIDIYFMQGYLTALEELKLAIDQWKIPMRELTFFKLLERALPSSSVRFTGEPLEGLQIMGVLETRALDFDNIIMLSMNERIFPRRHYTRSMIPDALRRGYGMATEDFQESIYAYYFYRLISRARQVEFLYDARTVGGKSNEISRYLAQLIYLYPEAHIRHRAASFANPTVTDSTITVQKSGEVMAKLDLFRSNAPEKLRRRLSASSINTYIDCPLNFYLQYVEGYRTDNEITDFMDSGTYGSVVHEVLQHIYMPPGKNGEQYIDSRFLDSYISSPHKIDPIITASINRLYNRMPDGDLTPLRGEARILGELIREFVVQILRADLKATPFIFMAAEEEISGTMRISPELEINIRQFIDRVDRVNPDSPSGSLIRLIDYKTGSDVIALKGLKDMFDGSSPTRQKAVLQLMFYCNAYSARHNYSGPIEPLVYLLKTIAVDGVRPITVNREEIIDYRQINGEFMDMFRAKISEIFDPSVPFTQATDDHACNFCNFREFCGKV